MTRPLSSLSLGEREQLHRVLKTRARPGGIARAFDLVYAEVAALRRRLCGDAVRCRRWTQAEDDELTAIYEAVPAGAGAAALTLELARRLPGRPGPAAVQRARLLGLNRRLPSGHSSNGSRLWTRDEEAIIAAAVDAAEGWVDWAALSDRLGRSAKAIRDRARHIRNGGAPGIMGRPIGAPDDAKHDLAVARSVAAWIALKLRYDDAPARIDAPLAHRALMRIA